MARAWFTDDLKMNLLYFLVNDQIYDILRPAYSQKKVRHRKHRASAYVSQKRLARAGGVAIL